MQPARLDFTASKLAPGDRTPDRTTKGHDAHTYQRTTFIILFFLNLLLHQMLDMSTVLSYAGFTSQTHFETCAAIQPLKLSLFHGEYCP